MIMDDNELSKLGHVFPDRPSFWDCKKMKKFIEFINLGKIIAKIELHKINGKTFLENKNLETILDQLNLKRLDQNILLSWRKLLEKYEKSFLRKKKSLILSDEETESEINGNSIKTLPKKSKYDDNLDETKTLKKYENEQIISCDEEEFEKEENFEKKKVRSDPLNERRKDNKGTENFKDKKSSSQKQNKKIYNIITDSLEEEKKNCNNKKIRKKINSSNDFENEKNLSSHKIKQNKNENEISKKKLNDKTHTKKDDENHDEGINEDKSQMNFSTKSSKTIKRIMNDENKSFKLQKEKLKDEEDSSSDNYNRRPLFPQEINEAEISKIQKSTETNIKQETVKKTSEKQEILKEQFTVGQINDNKFVIQLNKLNIISESKAIEYTFSNSFTIYRDCNLSNDNIYLEDSATSRNHARVILIEGRGFFLQDRGSSNFTYLKVNEKSKPPLEIGMELMIGFSLIKIKDIKFCLPLNGEVSNNNDKKYQVIMDTYLKYFLDRNAQKTEKTFFIQNELFFGSGPIVKKQNNNQNFYEELNLKENKDEEKFQFEGDEKIGENHLIFHLNDKEQIILEAKGPTYWVLRDEQKKSSDFYLLTSQNDFLLGNSRFHVENSKFNNPSICPICGNDFINSICDKCLLSDWCYNCAQKCDCGSNAFKKIRYLRELD